MRPLTTFVLFLALVAPPAAWTAPPIFFVSTDGNDAWSGTLQAPDDAGSDGPFATLTRARDALRAVAEDGGDTKNATVYVRGGTYYLDEPLTFGPEDSGTEGAPILWQAFKTEAVWLVGGKPLSGFEPDAGDVVKLKTDTPVEGLVFNGRRQLLARWPNEADGGVPGGGWTLIEEAVADLPKRGLRVDASRAERWADTSRMQLSIWPNYDWWQTIANVESFDKATGAITLAEDLPYEIKAGRRFFYQNIREELDAPGEWYYDPADSTLYFQPPSPLEDGVLVAPVLDNVIRIEGASYLTFIGFGVEAARSNGVVIKDSNAVTFARGEVRAVDGYGVTVVGGASNRIMGCDIHHTGRGGIILDGGDRMTLDYGNHLAENNHVHHVAETYRTYNTGVNIRGVGNRVRHNLIHDLPHIGILLGGNEHLLEYNEVYRVCQEGADNGAFYMGRDWTARGNILRYNRFHNVYGFGLLGPKEGEPGAYIYASPHQAFGVYLDDCSSGTTIYGNIFYRIPMCGVMIGGGRDNVVEHNIFHECIPAIHIDDRWDAFSWDLMQERLEAVNYKEPPYSERYPELLEMGPDPRKPENNRIARNVFSYRSDDYRGLSTAEKRPESAVVYHLDRFDPETTVFNNNFYSHYPEPRVYYSEYNKEGAEVITFEEWRKKGFDKNFVYGNPNFMDEDADDYRLTTDAAPFEVPLLMRHLMVPHDMIGLKKDEFRRSWPPPERPEPRKIEHTEYVLTTTAD